MIETTTKPLIIQDLVNIRPLLWYWTNHLLEQKFKLFIDCFLIMKKYFLDIMNCPKLVEFFINYQLIKLIIISSIFKG